MAGKMKVKAGWSTPMLHVQSIEKSIEFYRLLGFELIDTEGGPPIGWARMQCEGGAVMFLRAEHPRTGKETPVMLVMYTDDLPAFRAQLLDLGMDVRPINYPDYMRSGELMLNDPDGNVVLVNHWGAKEHEAWLAQVKEKKISP